MTATLTPTSAPPSAPTDEAAAARDALAERSFEVLLGAMELFSVHLGVELGLYEALHAEGPVSPAALAARCGIHPRYATEWLEQQAVAGILDVVASDVETHERVYALPAGHAEALLDPDSPASVRTVVPAIEGIAAVLPALVDAYRSGGGVPYAAYGTGVRHGIGGMNRPAFTHGVPEWLAAAPDLAERLGRGSGVRILDVGCGQGWSTIALARAYPEAEVVGVDLDVASIEDARRNAQAEGVAERVTFEARDALTVDELEGTFDAVCLFEVLHDMAHPIEALRRIRTVLAPGGAVLVADEKVADESTAPGDFNERFMYAWSAVHCLPATMAEAPSQATGTVIRRPIVEQYVREAGFDAVTELPVENDFWRIYRLT